MLSPRRKDESFSIASPAEATLQSDILFLSRLSWKMFGELTAVIGDMATGRPMSMVPVSAVCRPGRCECVGIRRGNAYLILRAMR